jgi:hypothetical protein
VLFNKIRGGNPMLKTALFGLAFTILLWQPAMAQTSNGYFGIGLRSLSESNEGGSDFGASSYQFTFGSDLNSNLSLEFNLSRDEFDTIDVGSASVDVETETIGFSLIFSSDNTSASTPYFRLGWGNRDASANVTLSDGRSRSLDDLIDSDSGLWYGIGMRFGESGEASFIIEASVFAEDTTGIIIGPQFYF